MFVKRIFGNATLIQESFKDKSDTGHKDSLTDFQHSIHRGKDSSTEIMSQRQL